MSDGSPVVFKTQTALAEWLGVSRVTLRSWLKRGMPTRPDGFDLQEVIRWRLKQTDMASQEADGAVGERRAAAELRRLEAQAAMAEIRAAQLAGNLIDRGAAEHAVREIVAGIRSRLQAIPGELAGTIPSDIRQDLTVDLWSKVNLILTNLAGAGEQWAAKAAKRPSGSKCKTRRASGGQLKGSARRKSRKG